MHELLFYLPQLQASLQVKRTQSYTISLIYLELLLFFLRSDVLVACMCLLIIDRLLP